MGEITQTCVYRFGLSLRQIEIALVAIFGHRARDSIIQAAVERPKLIDLNRRVQLERQISHSLAKVPVIMHYFLHGRAAF